MRNCNFLLSQPEIALIAALRATQVTPGTALQILHDWYDGQKDEEPIAGEVAATFSVFGCHDARCDIPGLPVHPNGAHGHSQGQVEG